MRTKRFYGRTGLVLVASLFTQQAFANNILSFGTPGKPDSWSYQGFVGDTSNPSGSTLSLLNIFSYYTATGFTGTTRDQFQFSARVTGGNTDHTTNGIGISNPGVSMQYYYNIVQPTVKDKMDPNFRTWWTNPQITLNLPNNNNLSSGFGAGANQYSISLQDNNYFAIGRLGISFNPISATYLFRDENPVAGSLTAIKRGWNVTFLDTAAGFWVNPDLMIGVQGQYNVNAIADSDLKRSESARLGPAFTYIGFKDIGLFFAGNYARDVYADNATHTAVKNNVFQFWVYKRF